jgi:penicillin-binding protein 1A
LEAPTAERRGESLLSDRMTSAKDSEEPAGAFDTATAEPADAGPDLRAKGQTAPAADIPSLRPAPAPSTQSAEQTPAAPGPSTPAAIDEPSKAITPDTPPVVKTAGAEAVAELRKTVVSSNETTAASAGHAGAASSSRPAQDPLVVRRRMGEAARKLSDAAPPPSSGGRGGAPRGPRKSGGAPFWAALLSEIALVVGSLALAGLGAALFLSFVTLAPRVPGGTDLWQVNREPAITILDRNGVELSVRGSRYGEAVAIADLPPYLVKAFLATEDRRFFEHGGVDIRGTFRALFANLRHGGVREGGSTITQQLARNLFLTTEQTYTRKAREALLALWLEGHYTKDEILSLYLNRIYLGAGAYGIEAAAKTYFNKSARNVTLSEAVMLAGLPKAPARLAPTLNPGGAQNRANEVLDNLVETGAITAFEAREAKKNPPVIASGKDGADLGYFFDYVTALAREIAGDRPGDLIITTTLDQRLQREAENAVAAGLDEAARKLGAEQGALVAYEVGGALRAMVGGRSYLESQFNRAVQAERQPGSSFKPFVFAAGFEAGLTPKSAFVDQPIKIGDWEPQNYKEGYLGRIRLTQAAAQSINTVAVQVTEYAGRRKVVEVAQRLGIKSDLMAVPSIALGAVNVNLNELTGAYVPFATGGLKPQLYAIERIEGQNLEVIYQHTAPAPRRVLTEQISEYVTHLLYQVMYSGTGKSASLGQRLSACKTGTTNDWRDALFVGYTAQIVAGVWVGNDAFTSMNKVTGGTIPARIWKQFMLAAHQDLPRLPLKGAYPAASYADESALIGFYQDVERGFRDVRRDGDERRGWRDF